MISTAAERAAAASIRPRRSSRAKAASSRARAARSPPVIASRARARGRRPRRPSVRRPGRQRRIRGLAARLLTRAVDPETDALAAALIPLSPLSPSTTYEVVFSGSVAGGIVSRNCRFTTAAPVVPTIRFASPTVPAGGTQKVTLTGLDREKGDYYVCHGPPHLVTSLAFEGDAEFVLTTSSDCASGRSCTVAVATSYHSSCASPFAEGSFAIVP